MEVLIPNFSSITTPMVIMWCIGGVLIYLAIAKEMEPTLLLPPARDAELASYNQTLLQECDSYLKEIAQKYQVPFLNYAYEEAYKSYKLYTV